MRPFLAQVFSNGGSTTYMFGNVYGAIPSIIMFLVSQAVDGS